MFDPNSPELIRPVQALELDGHDMPAFIRRHRQFLTLLVVVVAQLLLLSLQIIRETAPAMQTGPPGFVQQSRPSHTRLIRYWAVEAFDPFERALDGIAKFASTAYRTYRHLWHAEQENQELHIQLVAAQEQIQRLAEQAGETQHLRTLLDFKNQLVFQTVPAEVMYSSPASSPGENSNAVFIDKGSDSGLTTDLAVITPEGIVGKILAIFPHSAQVLLITDRSSGVGVMLATSRVQGILKGGSPFCNINYVMNEEVINRGEAVLTSGLDQVYPKGLPVGTVMNVGDGNIYKTITVKPAVDLSRLETVLVVLKPAPAEQQALNGTR